MKLFRHILFLSAIVAFSLAQSGCANWRTNARKSLQGHWSLEKVQTYADSRPVTGEPPAALDKYFAGDQVRMLVDHKPALTAQYKILRKAEGGYVVGYIPISGPEARNAKPYFEKVTIDSPTTMTAISWDEEGFQTAVQNSPVLFFKKDVDEAAGASGSDTALSR